METILFVLITTLPSHIIAFYQFWDFPWRSRTLALVLVALHVCLKTFAVYLALCGGLHIRVLEFAFSLIGLAIYLCLLRTDINATLFFFVLVMDYLIVVRGIATFASAWAFHSSSQSYVSSLICLLLYLLTLPPCAFSVPPPDGDFVSASGVGPLAGFFPVATLDDRHHPALYGRL